VVASLLLAAVAGLCMSALAPYVVHVVYVRGSFGQQAAAQTAEFLRWHGIALPFMVATIILGQAVLAFRAYVLVLAIAVARIFTKWLSVQWLVPQYGLTGLAASFIVPETVSAVLLAAALAWHVQRIPRAGNT
jgi:peptidoglycan biosynthesis protein MviN/MurJ (putative lipid II flippase)